MRSGQIKRITYAAAGVDTTRSAQAKKRIAQLAKTTFRPEVLSGIGFFGGFFEFKGYKKPVLVSSVDSVGTKIKLAVALDKHDTVGIDIVNHCINDIFTSGAEPLFFLDYIATANLVPERIEDVVRGMAKACKAAGCALIGGETAELPGIYTGDDYDLVGCIIGVVQKDKVILGKTIEAGDAIIGMPSNGLHTNGYSLARKVLGDTRKQLSIYSEELDGTVGAALLKPHVCYYQPLKSLLPHIKGMAHITGGGLVGNVPRSLPKGLAAQFNSRKWTVPPIFKLIKKQGGVTTQEMYHVFNMGIGMAVICAPENVNRITKNLSEARVVGEVVKQVGEARVIIDNKGYRKDKIG
ncbi:MAG: phosphoribosylformylglycinamidine cyclo-ligase [Dehalococcoidales bacterium]|nr:phosphoribosylformylglycinamidine cyclo-ligase [Dehalococcoidales bacterium]